MIFSLSDAIVGKRPSPLRVMVYGPEGVGKSTFAASAPSPIFFAADSGTEALDVARIMPRDFAAMLEYCALLEAEKHAYKTVVIDPVSWVEPMIYAHTCREHNWRDIEAPGYGKGYVAALDDWRKLIAAVERLWQRGMNAIFVGHSIVKPFQDPEGSPYDRYELSIHQKSAALLKQWCAYVLFARHESFSKSENGKTKGFSTGARIMHTQWTAAYDAKRRASIPDTMPLDWDAFVSEIEKAGVDTSTLEAEILSLASKLGLEEKAKLKIAAAKGDPERLAAIQNALEIKMHERGTT